MKQGTDVEGIETILLEYFERFERSEAHTVERPLQARMGTSYVVLRYRVYTKSMYHDIRNVFERLQHRTKSDIRVTLPRSTHIFRVDGPRTAR
ncbi:MAG: hypothetical protein ACRCWJ_15240 [Casimicrobium sp.]